MDERLDAARGDSRPEAGPTSESGTKPEWSTPVVERLPMSRTQYYGGSGGDSDFTATAPQ